MVRIRPSGIAHGCGWVSTGVCTKFSEIKKLSDDYH